MGTADCVVVGRIVRSERIASPSTRFTSPNPWWKVTIAVDETWVGVPAAEVVFWVEDNVLVAGWVGDSKEKLFLLVEGPRYKRAVPIYDDVPLTMQKIGFMSDSELPWDLTASEVRKIPTMRPTAFENRKELTEAMRPYCPRPLSISGEPICSGLGGWWVLFVPVDERSEALAHAWIRSGNPEVRWNGLRILRGIRSAANIALIQSLARLTPTTEADEVTREMARTALSNWGVPEPRTARVPGVSRRDVIGWNFWTSLLLLCLVPGLYLWRGWREGAWGGGYFWRVVVVLWLVLVAGFGVLWIRSHWGLDGACGGRWQTAMINGNIYAVFQYRKEAVTDWPWVYCRPDQLRVVREVTECGWLRAWDWRYPSWYFMTGWGVTSWLQDTPPIWAGVLVYRMPFWLVEAVLGFIGILVASARWGRRIARRWRDQRYHGFPVEMHDGS
ncbi:MAG: hypothetical protein WCI73_13780 [Phycisphaerae bacterium]